MMRLAMTVLCFGLLGTAIRPGAGPEDRPLHTEPNAMDPHCFNLTTSNQIAYSIFNTLIQQDETPEADARPGRKLGGGG